MPSSLLAVQLSSCSSGRILGLLVLPWLALSQVRCQPKTGLLVSINAFVSVMIWEDYAILFF